MPDAEKIHPQCQEKQSINFAKISIPFRTKDISPQTSSRQDGSLTGGVGRVVDEPVTNNPSAEKRSQR
ncbi:hypothetical protein QPK87_30160 [Kamptonema cortianum]|nr:hypothetical protein [Kamptonema cortianum]